MGTIVTLPPPRRRRRVSVQTTDEATILLFMGVRYVRDLEPEATPDFQQPVAPSCTEISLELA